MTDKEANDQRKSDLALLRTSASLPADERRIVMLEIVFRQEVRLEAITKKMGV